MITRYLIASLTLFTLACAPPVLLAQEATGSSLVPSLEQVQTKAEAGDIEACHNLARRLFAGSGVAPNPKKATFYLRQAAEGGHAVAQFEMALSVEKEAGERGDLTEVIHWLEKSAPNYPPAYRKLSELASSGRGMAADAEKATTFMTQAAEAGDLVAMNEMGVRYQNGSGLRKDPVAAIGWFSLAAQHGLVAATINLGNCIETGKGPVVDFNRAGALYSAAAQKNHPTAQALLARMFEEGRGTEKQPVYAYVNYRRAGNQGLGNAKKKADEIWATLDASAREQADDLLAGPVDE